jgi:hypothetical protein
MEHPKRIGDRTTFGFAAKAHCEWIGHATVGGE